MSRHQLLRTGRNLCDTNQKPAVSGSVRRHPWNWPDYFHLKVTIYETKSATGLDNFLTMDADASDVLVIDSSVPQIKVVTVGGPDVGKTSMLVSYIHNKFMGSDVPRTFGTYYSSFWSLIKS